MTAPRRAQAPAARSGLRGVLDWMLTAWQPAAIASAACLLVAGLWPVPTAPPAVAPAPEPAVVTEAASPGTVPEARARESGSGGDEAVTALEAPLAGDDSPPGPRLMVPAIGVSAPVRDVSVSEGELEIPGDPAEVGIWRGGASPGDDSGTVLVTGHVSWDGQRGALWTLAATSPGDAVQLVDAVGGTSHWRVESVSSVPRDADHPDLFTTSGEHRLVMVSCGGPLVDGHYRDLVVVVAVPG